MGECPSHLIAVHLLLVVSIVAIDGLLSTGILASANQSSWVNTLCFLMYCFLTDLWISAAKYQFEDLKDVSSARALLQQGLRANTSSQKLWLEVCRVFG